MILKNSSGKEREFIALLEVEKDKQKYVVYKDILTGNIYGGRKTNNDLKALKDSEYDFLNGLLEKIKE